MLVLVAIIEGDKATVENVFEFGIDVDDKFNEFVEIICGKV